MTHRPELKLKLEGAIPVPLANENGDVLLALRDGTFARLRFIRDGRNVTDIELERAEITKIPGVGIAGFSCAVPLDSSRVFLGSTTADSVLLGYTSGGKTDTGASIGMNDTVDDLDEIYGDDEEEGTVRIGGSHEKIRLQVHDFLMSTAPIRDITFGVPILEDVHLNPFDLTSGRHLSTPRSRQRHRIVSGNELRYRGISIYIPSTLSVERC
jgi:hypothetical protein